MGLTIGKILLVEDEVITAASWRLGLENAGYEVCPLATSGDKALIIATAEKPDVVLMDVNLPGSMNGLEVAQAIRDTLDTNIIFLTGYYDDDLIAKINALHPLCYLVKPVSSDRLLDALDKYLN